MIPLKTVWNTNGHESQPLEFVDALANPFTCGQKECRLESGSLNFFIRAIFKMEILCFVQLDRRLAALLRGTEPDEEPVVMR